MIKTQGTSRTCYSPVEPGGRGSTAGRSIGPGRGAGGVPSSTPSTAPIPRPPAPRGPSPPRPLQALALLNNALVLHLSEADRRAPGAARPGADPGRQVDRAYRLAFGRDARPRTSGRGPSPGRRAVRRGRRWPAALFNSDEFLYSIEPTCPPGGPSMDRREFFSWVRDGLAGAAAACADAPRRDRPGRRARRGRPRLPALRPQGDAGHPHLPLRRDRATSTRSTTSPS